MNYSGCRPLSENECASMIQAFTGRYAKRDIAFFQLGIRTGFRTNELLSIKVSDVYQRGQMLHSVTVGKAFMKGRRNSRSMPIHHEASEAIHKWIIEAEFSDPSMENQPLFCRQHTNKRLTRAQGWNIIKGAAMRADLDIKRVAGHSMRKTFAFNMWDSPFVRRDMAKMARLLSHENFSNTLKYLEFLDGSLEQAVLAA